MDPVNNKVFLLQQLPLLVKVIFHIKAQRGYGFESETQLGSFTTLIEEMLTSGEVTIPVVFACMCWMKSVAALQGNAGLGRNISLTFKHSTQLMRSIEATAAKHSYFTHLRFLARANPLFAGLMMLDHHFMHLQLAHEAALSGSTLRLFGHLYNALVKEGYLQLISMIDDMLEIYNESVFAPSQAAAKHGSYYRTYLRSLKLRTPAVDAAFRAAKGNAKAPSELYFNTLSQTFRLVKLNDKSELGGASWPAILEGTAKVCSAELFESRVQSRDLLRLNDDFGDVFSEICRVLEQRDFYNFAETQTSDRAATFMLQLLDAMQPGVNVRLRLGGMPGRPVSFDTATDVCKEIAAMIGNRYAAFDPDLVTQEYGSVSFKKPTMNENREQVFADLMAMLEGSDGPLSENKLSYLKEEIRKDPLLLGVVEGAGTPAEYSALCTLLHQAAAGPAHNCELVEWMAQMGALLNQPLHCRKEPLQKDRVSPRDALPNTMAVHSAAIAGNEHIVSLLLQADNMVDLNTPTFHSKETLVHLAVKNGNRSLFSTIWWFGADLGINTGDGRRVCDLTDDEDWARELATSLPKRHKNQLRAELHSWVSTQKETRNPGVTTRSDGKKTSKKGKKKTTNEESMIANAAELKHIRFEEKSRLVTSLLVSAGLKLDANTESTSITTLEELLMSSLPALFTRLRDTNICANDKIDDVQHATKVIEELMAHVQRFSDRSRINSTLSNKRSLIAATAAHCIQMMQRFYRVDDAALRGPELAAIRELCAVSIPYTKFVVGTAQLLISVDKEAQARHVLEVLEKRLLKMPFAQRNLVKFREVVETYSAAREEMGFGQTSSSDALSRLDWYLTSAVGDYQLQLILDKLVGQTFYCDFVLSVGPSDHQFKLLTSAITATPELSGVVCFPKNDKRIIHGGPSKADLAKTRAVLAVLSMTWTYSLTRIRTSRRCTSEICLGSFMLSVAGVFRAATMA
ncbi:Ankyrin repeats (many copies) [Phytophthora infestans]|uniref:Ankyrin repeats (Many copies) n=1 Tax=Phytophthora infestans TaxID=4787 RepID=A0A833WYR9_PHYIN|nr:Ankyrin repeats (many copies) [Phytophthora infestans]